MGAVEDMGPDRSLQACLIGVVLAVLAPARVEGAPNPCAAGPILEARMEGCDIPRCLKPGFTETVLDLGDFESGRILDPAGIESSKKRLKDLGFFRSVDVECRPRPGGLDLVLHVEPRKRLNAIHVDGQRHFYDSTLIDRLSIQRGDYLDPTMPETAEVLERVNDRIKRAFMEEGFHGTVVTSTILPLEDGLVDLHIGVKEGERHKIASIVATLEPESGGSPDPEADPDWSCPRVKIRDLRNWAGLAVGNPYTDKTEATSVQNLKGALRTIGFAGVQVKARFEPETRLMTIKATYDSCYLLRFFIRDHERPGRQGFRPLAELEILESLPFGDSGVFDLTEARIGSEEIRQFFLNRGFLLADVKLDYRSNRGFLRSRRWAEDQVAGVISYFVTTHGRREIRGIRITGNEALSDESITAVMNTKPYDFFGDTGSLLPEQVFYDLDRIRALYSQNGFSDMQFHGGAERADGVVISQEGPHRLHEYSEQGRSFRVRFPRGTEGIYLEIGIQEGKQDRLGPISLEGMTDLSREEILSVLVLEEGQAFSAKGVTDAVNRLISLYSNEGYLNARVQVFCSGHEPEVPRGQCSLDSIRSDRVDLHLKITEGRLTKVLAVLLEGNFRTLDPVILFGFPSPGEPYRIGEVAEAVKELKNLGIFTSVQVRAVGVDEDPPPEEVVLVVTCREDHAQFVDIAVGFEDLNRSGEFPSVATSVISTSLAIEDRSSTGFGSNVGLKIPDILLSAEVRYTDLNFLGRGKRLYLPLKYGLSSTAWVRYAAFTPSYVDPRFFASGLTFRFTPFVVYDRATTSLDLFETGMELALSKELVPHLYGSLTYEIAGISSRDPEVTSDYSAFRLENKLRPSIIYDRLDHPIDPKKGGMLQATLSYINAYISNSFNNYLKFEITGKFFWSIRDYLTFAMMARFGTSQSFEGSARLPDEERFTLGGNRGVRGFSNDGIAQYNEDGSLRLERADGGTLVKPHGGDHMVSGSFEIRFPILRELSLNGAIFYDFGALSEHITGFSGASFRHSVGVGLRFLIADTVPVRLDYGVILDRRCSEVDPFSGLCVLREEVGNIHFGLLYTF